MTLHLPSRSRGVPAPPHATASQPEPLSASPKLAPQSTWPEPIARILQVPHSNPISALRFSALSFSSSLRHFSKARSWLVR
jgi:hypothetical protein